MLARAHVGARLSAVAAVVENRRPANHLLSGPPGSCRPQHSTRSASRSQLHLMEPIAPPGLSLASRTPTQAWRPLSAGLPRPPACREKVTRTCHRRQISGRRCPSGRRRSTTLSGRTSAYSPRRVPLARRDGTADRDGPRRARVSDMDDVSRPASPVLAEDALLGLLLPFWQLIIGAFVLFAVLVSIGRLARRGPSRMSTALLITAAAIAGFALVGVLLQG
jgi:hypothetical protein